MKTIFEIMFLLFATTVLASGEKEIKASVHWTAPGDDDTWDKSLGGELQMIFWVNPEVGIAPSIGLESWKIKKRSESAYDPYQGLYAEVSIEGNATTIPIGVSVVAKPRIAGNVGLTFEGGFRYVPVSSGIDASALITDGIDVLSVTEKVELESGFVGLVAGDVRFVTGPKQFLYLGLGYQIDLTKGNATWFDIPLGENEFKGLLVRGGIGFSF